MFKSLNLIVCCDADKGIGLNNTLPWNIKSEMELFQKKTIGEGNNCVIMGKNTYLSIPSKFRPLKKRDNYIVSRSFATDDKGTLVIRNLDDDITELILNTNYDTYWVIGGESIYHMIIESKSHLINEIHISILDAKYDCDTKFPEINLNKFTCTSETYNKVGGFTHTVYTNTSTYQNTDCL